MTTWVDRGETPVNDQAELEGRVAELERRLADLEEWLGEVADDLIERTGVA